MEAQKLMKIWQAQDEKLSKSIEINKKLLKEVSFNRINSLLREQRYTSIFELVAHALAVFWLMGFVWNVLGEGVLLFHTILLLILMYSGLFLAIYKLVQLSKVHYTAPILETQERLERLIMFERWELNLLYVAIPLFSLSFLIVLFSYLLGINVSEIVGWKLQLNYLIGSVVVGIIIVTLIKKFPDRKMEKAIGFLKELGQYEK